MAENSRPGRSQVPDVEVSCDPKSNYVSIGVPTQMSRVRRLDVVLHA